MPFLGGRRRAALLESTKLWGLSSPSGFSAYAARPHEACTFRSITPARNTGSLANGRGGRIRTGDPLTPSQVR
jgi:hypothetical protein